MNEEQIAGVVMGAMGCDRRAHYGNVEQPFCGKHGHYGNWPCPAAVEVATALAPLITAAKAEAFEQGQKSGMRHADRLIAAAKIGRPDLPGPISPNPYRTEAQ